MRRARLALADVLGTEGEDPSRRGRIALVGLRGAGKSTLGRMLAEDLGVPFVELSREIERLAGCSTSEVHALYGANAYRRYERRALEEAIAGHASAVIATPGGLVSDVAAFDLLLARCYTVWLQATPEEHMRRVAAQGDLRPDGGERGGHGGPAPDPRRARRVLLEGGLRRRHRRAAAGRDVRGPAAAGAPGSRTFRPDLAGTGAAAIA